MFLFFFDTNPSKRLSVSVMCEKNNDGIDELRELSGEFVGSMYGRIAKPRSAQRDDHDSIRYGPLPENVQSFADQQEELVGHLTSSSHMMRL
jgi:hypothetical protein